MNYYRAYITRGGKEHEVVAKLSNDGTYETGYEPETGPWIEIMCGPEWTEFICFDDHGVELQLTHGEIEYCIEQLNHTYWEEVL